MTSRKAPFPLPSRTPAYVDRETGAAELCISVSTWDEWVSAGLLPRPVRLGANGGTPRWRWGDVERHLAGERAAVAESQPFFRMGGLTNGAATGKRRGTA